MTRKAEPHPGTIGAAIVRHAQRIAVDAHRAAGKAADHARRVTRAGRRRHMFRPGTYASAIRKLSPKMFPVEIRETKRTLLSDPGIHSDA